MSLVANIAGGKTTPETFSMRRILDSESEDGIGHEEQLTSILGPLIKPEVPVPPVDVPDAEKR
jgi:hypothetical protein